MLDHDSIPARKWASNLPVSHRVGHSSWQLITRQRMTLLISTTRLVTIISHMPMAILRSHLPLRECTRTQIAASGQY